MINLTTVLEKEESAMPHDFFDRIKSDEIKFSHSTVADELFWFLAPFVKGNRTKDYKVTFYLSISDKYNEKFILNGAVYIDSDPCGKFIKIELFDRIDGEKLDFFKVRPSIHKEDEIKIIKNNINWELVEAELNKSLSHI